LARDEIGRGMTEHELQETSVWRRAGRLLLWWPWAISAAAHLAVLGGLSAVVFISFEHRPARREIVPEARLGKVDPQLPLFQDQQRAPLIDSQKLVTEALARQIESSAQPQASGSQDLDLAVLASGGSVGSQAADLGQVAPIVPRTRFFNTAGNAYSVIYVVDVSPSMLPFFDPLKRELGSSLGELQPMQKFHVIFFSSGEPIEGPAKGLTWASDRNKRTYIEFVDQVQTDIKTDPRWAVRRALELNPDLVYLLTDGVFDEKLADQIIEWSKARQIKINTLAYVNERGAFLLRKIAEQTGGVYRFVAETELKW